MQEARRVALVTGAAGGIGAAVVRRWTQQGVAVVAVDTEERAAAADEGELVKWLAADLSVPASLDGLIEQAAACWGHIDYLVNNAAVIGEVAPLTDIALPVLNRVVATNLIAPIMLTAAATRHMAARGGGAVVNVASVAGLSGGVSMTGYVVSKHGLIGLTRAAARECAHVGVRVNAVCPGATDTTMIAAIEAGISPTDPAVDRQRRQSNIPMGRYAQPSEVAAAITWVCSDEASYMTGACVVVDGGQLA
jgi:NAD(P)-dependent dehydrogenase (short-subunit alcohol dehydrogenase family)